LDVLYAKLAATPPTISVTYQDEEGDSYTVEESNPEYDAILDQIAPLEDKLEKMEECLVQLEASIQEIESAVEWLDIAKNKINELKEQFAEKIAQILSSSEDASNKLNSAAETIEEYRDAVLTAGGTHGRAASGGLFRRQGANSVQNHERSFRRSDGASTIEDAARSANPNFSHDSYEWSNNCQRCVPTYEMRRRGYDVTAQPLGRDMHLSYYPFDAWENPQVVQANGTGREDIVRALERSGDGSRAQVVVMWDRRGAGGHTFIAENHGGQVRFIDPQNNCMDATSHFSRVREGSTQFCRIDNIRPSSRIIDCCVNRN